ncbi:MAG: hypothetical protein DCC71_10205 [Proteobacteria bacterium]|nr:MAG: hypothetical protein DCC71_10205 [Pseudomonadota bacterium]
MARACPACRARDLPPESRFCLACGAPLAETAADGAAPYTPALVERVIHTRSAREGERKQVTILIADVAGSLALAERLDPEDVHVLMDGFFALALDAVHAERGTLNQFRGDGFMALFGAPVARENHALDAVRAALAVRRASQDYNRSTRARFGVPFVIRIGLATGPVWVGAIGSRLRLDYTAEGSTVGIAARLEELASPGQILVTEAVAARVERHVELAALGTRSLRNVSEPVGVFEVVRAGAHESALDAERAHGLGRLVGRDAELAAIAARLAAVARGAALWLELAGETGIGKSRLAHEVRARDPQPWLEGRCREPQATRAYGFWRDLLRRWPAELAGADEVEAALRLLDGAQTPRAPGETEARLRALLECAAREQPVCVLVEDAQWMDRASRAAIDKLLAEPPAAGVRFLATVRDDGAPVLAAASPRAERIGIGALSADACEEIARTQLAAHRNGTHLAKLAALRAGGNPLFALELGRALAEGEPPLRHAAELELALHRAGVRVPTTLRDVVAARIDSLPDGAKRLLQSAAVIGRGFDAELLAALDVESGDAVAAQLAELTERGLLVARDRGFDFHHDVVRDVAYGQMLRSRAQALHLRCAEALERAGCDATPEGVSEIGWHFDLGGAPLPAARALARAGARYRALFAPREAAAHLRRAWELVASLPDGERDGALRLDVGLDLSAALNTLDHTGEACAVLEELSADAESVAHRDRLAAACVESGWVGFTERGEAARSCALLERGIALARESGQRAVEAQGHGYRIRVCHIDGRIEDAMESARRVTELGTAAGERFGAIFGLGNEGYVACDAGQVGRAVELCERACELAREARHEVGLALASGWLAKALVFRGDLDAALRLADEARGLAAATSQQSALYNAEIAAGCALSLLDQPKAAAEAWERLVEINARWATTIDWLGAASLETGRFAEAVEHARNCLATRPPRLVRVRTLRTLGLGLALGRAPDFERAEDAIGESLTLAVDLGLVPHAAAAHAALAELCARRGEPKRVRWYAERARREWESCGMHRHAERADALLELTDSV